ERRFSVAPDHDRRAECLVVNALAAKLLYAVVERVGAAIHLVEEPVVALVRDFTHDVEEVGRLGMLELPALEIGAHDALHHGPSMALFERVHPERRLVVADDGGGSWPVLIGWRPLRVRFAVQAKGRQPIVVDTR